VEGVKAAEGGRPPSDASSDIDTDTDIDTDGNAGEADEEIKRAEHQMPNQRSLTRLLQTVPRVWRQFVVRRSRCWQIQLFLR